MKIGSPFDEQTYVLSCDEGKENPRSVVFTQLTVGQDAYLDNLQSEVTPNGYLLNTGTVNLMALHLGLKKLVNFFDKNGNQINLERDKKKAANLPEVGRPWKEKALDWIPKYERMVIAERIRSSVNLSEEELKN